MPAEAGDRSTSGEVILPEIAASDKGESAAFPHRRSYARMSRAPAAGLATRSAELCSRTRYGAPSRPRRG